MKIDDVGAFMEAFLGAVRDDPTILESVISRVAPGGTCFAFSSPDEFETKANAEALALLPQLLDKSFHVRVHRRGFKGRLESHEEERYLGHVLLEAMYAAGQPGALTFEDPDMIVAAEIVSNHASLACWSRKELERYTPSCESTEPPVQGLRLGPVVSNPCGPLAAADSPSRRDTSSR